MTLRLVETKDAITVDADALWEAALSRDSTLDGMFIVAVRSTGIYCRPSCSARKPKRENVMFFPDCDSAEDAGFRACKRCHPRDKSRDQTAQLVQKACRYLEDGDGEEPLTLPQIGRRLGVSADALARLFRRTLGVTPREYAEARRLQRLKEGLRDGASVTDALYDAGYSSSSRLYENAGEQLGMTPATYRKGGRGMKVRYDIRPCTLGRLLVAGTDRGVCCVQLGDSDSQLGVSLRGEFPEALIERDDGSLSGWADQILDHLRGVRARLDVPLDVQGTAFQFRVWRALSQIAYGSTRSYSDVARAIGRPSAVRAVARACATNPVPLVIPCHRVVRANGELGGYGQGIERKRKLLEQEKATAPALTEKAG